MREQARRLSDNAAASIIAGAQVVVATCAGSAERRLQDMTFPVVLVDEAGQATEPSTLVPITRGASCVVLAGDHKQLPPTVVSRQAIAQHLDVTLFERVQAAGVLLYATRESTCCTGITYTSPVQVWSRCC